MYLDQPVTNVPALIVCAGMQLMCDRIAPVSMARFLRAGHIKAVQGPAAFREIAPGLFLLRPVRCEIIGRAALSFLRGARLLYVDNRLILYFCMIKFALPKEIVVPPVIQTNPAAFLNRYPVYTVTAIDRQAGTVTLSTPGGAPVTAMLNSWGNTPDTQPNIGTQVQIIPG